MSRRHAFRPLSLALLLGASTLGTTHRTEAFTYVLQAGDNLPALAQRFYGRVQNERLIVTASGLGRGDARPSPGTRLEVPALEHYQVQPGDSWDSLAVTLLGHVQRAVLFSQLNGSSPWLKPEPGSLVLVPYNLRYVTAHDDTLSGLAFRFLGDRTRAWSLAHYNDVEGEALAAGTTLLIPLVDLPLTSEGLAEARRARDRLDSETRPGAWQTQEALRRELPSLLADVRQGRYVEAVARGVRLLAAGGGGVESEATIQRELTVSYVALGAPGLAAESCARWRSLSNGAPLDPMLVSPKILDVCRGAATASPPESTP